jgi:hypothetical protein
MKEKTRVCSIGLLLGTNHGCITTNPNQSMLQCNGNIPGHIQSKSLMFKVTPSAGKVMLTVFWDFQWVLLVHFQKRGENINSVSLCEVLMELRNAIRRKDPGQLARGVLLHGDNARQPHTAQATQERIQELQWELLEHLPYSPDLAPSDFHLMLYLSILLHNLHEIYTIYQSLMQLKNFYLCIRPQQAIIRYMY